MTSFTIILSTIVVLIAIFAGYIYVVGLSPGTKRKMEEKALETMGEASHPFTLTNKASYVTKDMLGKVPDSDQQELKDLKGGLSNAAGGALQNPLGKLAGDVADEGTRPATGR
ncbi:hypothetical protein DOTSEDRAFT_131088 [Dothistroma septosporum NZE10]|uniref:Uncharacterized protein n=1 Tax=Dothistroma septosporum (strain NZE10 / CBS 128990) TaxID=675120 RepID=N1PLB3_DOTSN|nr:hypothetical protein DOTSEDRAFT_131088 [Dothistroma septosporum NZE10]